MHIKYDLALTMTDHCRSIHLVIVWHIFASQGCLLFKLLLANPLREMLDLFQMN